MSLSAMAYLDHQSAYNKPGTDIHLRPIYNAPGTPSLYAGSGDHYFEPVPSHPVHNVEFERLQASDQQLKYRIRILRLVARVIATVSSAATLAPLTMTLYKFLSTRNIYYTVNGKQRTAWAADTETWFTYMYFGVSLVSFVFNLAIVLSYWRGVREANSTAKVAGWWEKVIMVGHVVVWVVSAVIYRIGKEPVNGKFR